MKSRYPQEEGMSGSPIHNRWRDPTAEDTNYAGLVWIPEAQNYNPCLKLDVESNMFRVPPSLPGKPGYGHFNLLVEHMAELGQAQQAVGRIRALTLGKVGSGFFVGPHLFVTRSHMWATDLEFSEFALTDIYHITTKADASVGMFEFPDRVMAASFVGVFDDGDLALFKVHPAVEHTLPVTKFTGQLVVGDVLVSIGYNGAPSQDVLNKNFQHLPLGERPSNPPPAILAYDLLSPHWKTASVGKVINVVDNGLVHVGSTVEVGASGSPVFLLRHNEPIRLIGMVLGGSFQYNGNRVTLFTAQADVDFIVQRLEQ